MSAVAVADGGVAAARAILDLAEEERQLVHDGRVDELDALHERRTAAMAGLPEMLCEEAQVALRHALALQNQITVALRDGLAATGAELAQVGHGRAAARGYAPAGVDPRRTLDRSA